MELYPLLMSPYFRHGEQTPWGGSMLRDVFLKDAPDDRTGESLEISALPGRESVVRNGVHAGKPLSEMIALWGEALTGGGLDMPLLLKILDAREFLSVQVHPDDEGDRLGKSEAWMVLWAQEGARLVYGLEDVQKPLAEIVADGALEIGKRTLPRAIPVVGSPPSVQGEGWAEALKGGHGLGGRQRVQLEGVRRPNRKGLQAQLGIFWLGTGVENARFIGGAPIVRVEEQPVDGRLGSAAQSGVVGGF